MFGMITSYQGIRVEDLSITMYLHSAIANADHKGNAVCIVGDRTAGYTDGTDIFGILESYETRVQEGVVTGAVNPARYATVSYTGAAPALGSRVVSNGLGGVKTAGANTGLNTTVMSVNTDDMTCEILVK